VDLSSLESETLALARSYLHVREVSPNSSPEIDKWLAFTHCHPGDPYCASYASYCIGKAAVTTSPAFLPSAGALRLLKRNEELKVSHDEARVLLAAGIPLVFIQDHGGGKGHAGFATGLVDDGHFSSLEANTGPGPAVAAKDREGDGVYERHDRAFAAVKGFLRIA
jgi:hypothetical protein